MAGNDLTVRVDANTTGYEAAIARAERQTNTFAYSLRQADRAQQEQEKQLAAQARQMDATNQAMARTGRGIFLFGAAVAAGLGLAVNEAVKWETAWTGVTKTVDGSAPQMARLESDLRQLATTLPATHEEIAAVAEAAGQLGIQRDSIIGFTKTMIDLSETTNLTAEQAATDIARLSNIMGTSSADVDRMGSSIVALGNNSATTEAEILSMATRIAGAGAQLNLTEGEVFGIAAALSSVGVEAQAGGSAISQVMKDIQLEVSTGGDRLEDFARIAGMSAQEFKTLWGQDAAAGLNAVVAGLGNIKDSGGDVIKTLSDLEITQIRQSDALLRLAGGGDLLADSLQLGNDAWRDNNALVEEAAKRYATTEAKVQVARNQLRDMGIDIGTVLLPALAAMAGTLSNLVRAWSDLPGPMKTTLVVVAALTAGVALLGGALLIAIPRIAAFNAAVAGLNAGALKSAGTRLASTASVLAGPWGLALAGGIAALGIFASKHGDAARQVDALKATLDEQTGALTANSTEWAIKKLSDEGALDAAKKLGIDLGLITDAALGNEGALAAVNGQTREYVALLNDRDSAGLSGDMADQAEAADLLNRILGGTNGTLDDARAKWDLEKDAKAGSVEASDAAAAAQDGTTQAWEEGADAAGDLTEEVKSLGEQLADLSETYLNQREAGRAVRDSLRGIQKAVREYRKENKGLEGAFKDGTKSGDEFGGMLDDLAGDYQKQIETTQKLTGSERKTMQVYRESRANLVQVAQQLGMTKKEAEKYADQVLQTPKTAKTLFSAETQQAAADIAALQRAINEAARNRQARIDVTVSMNRQGFQTSGGLQEANGGIVQAYADGGFSSSGAYVQRVPQIRQGGGAVVWNEPETGWEAYISGKPSMIARNREVWSEAGRRLGFDAGGGGGGVVSVDLGQVQIAGTLDTPWGPAEVRGIALAAAREATADRADTAGSRARLSYTGAADAD